MRIIRLTKKLKWVFIAVLLSALAWFLLFRDKNNASLVRRVSTQKRVVERTAISSGTIKSKSQADLAFQNVGKIAYIGVNEGDFVKKGSILANLDIATQSKTVQYYKDALDIELRQRDLYVHDEDENIDLYGGRKAYEIKLREYNESVDQAQAQYGAQISVLNNMYLRAPFNGTITDITYEVGEISGIGSVAVKIADLNSLIFRISVDQEDFGLIKEGMKTEIELDSYANEVFNGVVEKTSLYVDEDTDKFEVDIKVDASDKQLAIGMIGDAHIVLQSSETEVPSISVDDISYDDEDNPFVWIMSNGKLKKKQIEIVLEGDLFAQLKEDITETILVPAKDGQKMVEGYTAKVIN